jgi:hypothetical protein|uniref:Uncharacterized protein n=1 Tax=Siphoviridae sp. ctqwY3 TaxID=2827951 RepID=A0A8S5S6H0_9CAUD|nr:MAG TPA: hypothetical protein [Siphoviridae sp. ctqwY3]
MNFDKEVAQLESESINDYKFRLLIEYREIVEKRALLERFINENNNKNSNEIMIKKLDLMKRQLEILYQYEEIIATRLKLELQ